MMRSSISERVVAISLLLVTTGMSVHTSLARAQDKPSGTLALAKIELTTDPSPAQKGNNTVRVKLTDPAGKPIVGAKVAVTFFMPAMPAMNMAEMKTVIQGTYKGGGMYEGKGDLGSGGMWEVTITATQNGQTIATKKLTVKATSGA